MDKNWLIRTKSNHILGPVSKEKVLELYHNGSIKGDDEVCSGNGFWFFIREDDLVSKYLLGSEVQSFNPISEAKNVLTSKTNEPPVQEESDITLVSGIDLSKLKEEQHEMPPVPEAEAKSSKPHLVTEEEISPEPKKKTNVEPVRRKLKPRPQAQRSEPKPLKKQDWMKYLLFLGFVILFLMVYFRNTIISHLFEGEMTYSVSLIQSAHAQDTVPAKKKRLLETSIPLDKITFTPVISLDGFRVETTFDLEELNCDDLKNDVYQLGVVLYPPEKFNEKFLIKLRDCVVKLPDTHPVKKWMKDVAEVRPLSKKDQKKIDFVKEIINSQYNLITDLKIKTEIINILGDIPENTIPEKLLKSYLYLMVGNIARSDNILRSIIVESPRINWTKTGKTGSYYHRVAKEEQRQIFSKLSKHPADRKTFQLFVLYLQSFYNDPELLTLADSVDTSDVENKINLKIMESVAPSFIHYLRLAGMNEAMRTNALRGENFSQKEQSYWFWGFLDIDPLISDKMIPELERVEKEDELWFIYLLDNEKLADLFSRKSGRSFLPGRRPFLKATLNDKKNFMMALYKLIELGDINHDLVLKTTDYLIND